MAVYKYAYFLIPTKNARFDHIYPAGAKSPLDGIYRCEGCGREVIAKGALALPGSDHHHHAPEQGTVRWRLVIAIQG
jgi:hypothetical protein